VEAACRPKPTALPQERLLPPWKRVGRATLPQTPIVLRIKTMRSPGQIQAKVPKIRSGSARGSRLPPKAYGVALGTSATPLETRGETHAAPDPYRTAHRGDPAVARPNPSQGARNLLRKRSWKPLAAQSLRRCLGKVCYPPGNAWGEPRCPRPLSYCA
jgi:hypothetical protein